MTAALLCSAHVIPPNSAGRGSQTTEVERTPPGATATSLDFMRPISPQFCVWSPSQLFNETSGLRMLHVERSTQMCGVDRIIVKFTPLFIHLHIKRSYYGHRCNVVRYDRTIEAIPFAIEENERGSFVK